MLYFSLMEQMVKAIPFLYSITVTVTLAYQWPRYTNTKEIIRIKAGIIIILIGGIVDLVINSTCYNITPFNPSVIIYLGSILLILALIHVIRSLFEHAHKDGLTGAYNKRALYYSIERRISMGPNKKQFTIAFIDIDDFKAINDDFGHLAADSMLKDACKSIRKKIRKQDLLFRYGGDEFVLLVPDSNKIETGQIMNRLKSELNNENIGILQFSYGMASYPEDGNSTEILLNKADMEMYCQKTIKIRKSTNYKREIVT